MSHGIMVPLMSASAAFHLSGWNHSKVGNDQSNPLKYAGLNDRRPHRCWPESLEPDRRRADPS